WTSKRSRLERAGVPAECRTARTKPEMALAEIDRAIAAGVRFGCVLADAGYGLSAPFRQGLTARKLAWAVGIPRHLKVYPADVRMIWPVAKRGRPRQRHLKAASDPAHRWRGERSGASSTAILRRDELCTRKTHFRSTVRPEPRLGPRAVQHIASRYCT